MVLATNCISGMHTDYKYAIIICSPQLAGFIRRNELNNKSTHLGGTFSSSWKLFDHVTEETFLSLLAAIISPNTSLC